MKYTFLTLVIFLLIGGCDSEAPSITMPSNLILTVEVVPDGSGKVNVFASADNAQFYTFTFGTEPNTPVKSAAPRASYTYTEVGTYTIGVQAHATDNDFISLEKQVTITQLAGGDIVIPTTGYTTPDEYPGMSLVWQDEFSGTTLNSADWTYEFGAHGWGNNEKQDYGNKNVSFQDGHLIITAKKESTGGSDYYTSSRIITKDKKEFKYGRIDIRAVLPEGQGIWPALWMLGANFAEVGWPASGEIDIMEMVGGSGRENTVHGTVHWDHAGNYASYTDDYKLGTGTFKDKFHVFTIIWDETKITWYVDDVQFNVIDITPADLSEFREPYFFIFNVAVGGNWPGNPNASTVFPQRMIVDYVRVFQEND